MNQAENKNDERKRKALYDFSKTKMHVIPLQVTGSGYHKIDYKLPKHIKEIKHILLTVNCTDHKDSKAKIGRLAGYVSLNFNGQTFKTLTTAIMKTYLFKDCPNPFEVNVELEPNSFMQGYYLDAANPSDGYPYTLNIYLHYIPDYNKK